MKVYVDKQTEFITPQGCKTFLTPGRYKVLTPDGFEWIKLKSTDRKDFVVTNCCLRDDTFVIPKLHRYQPYTNYVEDTAENRSKMVRWLIEFLKVVMQEEYYETPLHGKIVAYEFETGVPYLVEHLCNEFNLPYAIEDDIFKLISDKCSLPFWWELPHLFLVILDYYLELYNIYNSKGLNYPQLGLTRSSLYFDFHGVIPKIKDVNEFRKFRVKPLEFRELINGYTKEESVMELQVSQGATIFMRQIGSKFSGVSLEETNGGVSLEETNGGVEV